MTMIGIVGAGFSGTLLALHLLRRCPADTRVILIERNARFGPGAAYATGNPSHLLNVPAGRMSAFHDRPRDFIDWLAAQPHQAGCPEILTEGCFVPRQVFGAYIRNLLLEEIRLPGNPGRLKLVRGNVLAVNETPGGLEFELTRGRRMTADFAVLATGNFPPEPPPGADLAFLASRYYAPDPWAASAYADLDPDQPVLMIGTGLTTIDATIELLDRGHRGPIHALSRRGLLPRRHSSAASTPPPPHRPFPTDLRELTRLLREESEAAEATGRPWQSVIDALRPFTQDVWLEMSPADRKRFLRHLRPWWDVHRHRMAPQVGERIDQVRATGQFKMHVGRIRALTAGEGHATLEFRDRASGDIRRLDVARVINCSGPSCDFDRIADPLVRDLLASGMVRPDALKLGLDVSGTCALKNAKGAISRRLFAIGPPTKGAFWEMTAVPDLRRQTEFLATHLTTLVKAAPRAAAAAATPGRKLPDEAAWSYSI
jgi:uncharacterized NAD(P)/FAD-binding protein YdhS